MDEFLLLLIIIDTLLILQNNHISFFHTINFAVAHIAKFKTRIHSNIL